MASKTLTFNDYSLYCISGDDRLNGLVLGGASGAASRLLIAVALF
jgi:hypothetical protein